MVTKGINLTLARRGDNLKKLYSALVNCVNLPNTPIITFLCAIISCHDGFLQHLVKEKKKFNIKHLY